MSHSSESQPLPPNATIIPGFPDYCITPNGHVFSKRKGGPPTDKPGKWKILKQSIGSTGYLYVTLYREKYKLEKRMIHRLLAETFIGPCPDGMLVRHLDDVKTTNNVGNIAYGTDADNSQDALRNGRVRMGDKHYNSRLTSDQVYLVKRLRIHGMTAGIMADAFMVHRRTIQDIIDGKTWKSLSAP